MNAFNLIDGIDGLAGGFGLISTTFFGAGFLLAGEITYAVLSMFVALTLIGFLYYNTEPAKIFMGDSGSLTVGFLLGVLAINFTGLSGKPAFANVFGDTSPVYAAVFLVLPLYDTLRVYIRRVAKRRSPFMPDNDHVHHIFINLGFSHRKTSMILYGSTLLVILSTFALYRLNSHIIFLLMFVMIFLFMPTFGVKRRILLRLGLPIEHWLYNPQNRSNQSNPSSKDESSSQAPEVTLLNRSSDSEGTTVQ
jgi:UDP-N-acetylmuramyl pentapeptide phosphotransferase/UDP-N-acetylglucosamine-1-phosphate transferase